MNLYTRRLDNVTKMFPEIVKAVTRGVSDDCIIEGEGVGYNQELKSYKPFQEISKRIRRKYGITELMKKTPVVLYIFDIFNYKDKNCLNLTYRKRLKILKKIIKEIPWQLELAKQIITSDEEKAVEFYKEALLKDQEGVMMKNLNAPYQPGSRVGYGIKIKPLMETLDLKITHATVGAGRRSKWFGSFYIACKKDDEYVGMGKVGTGLTDEQLSKLNKMIVENITHEDVKGRKVKVRTNIIIEVGYEEIQKSPTYSSGYALRFPRVIRLRPDKDEPDSIKRVNEIYKSQGKIR